MSMGLSPGLFVAGRYRLDRLVGEGGMSWVWAATNVITARPVALKFLKRPAARATDRFRRFIEEARATIPHRHVVHIYDLLYLEGDVPFIVMELLRGGTLRDEIRSRGRLSLEAACALVCPVVSALGSAHALGVIHCDLKSENIFLANEGDGEITVKVLDFGLARQMAMDLDDAAGPVSLPRRRQSTPFGTVGYAAPEQGVSSRVDHRADIWALGVVLFECLTGERPFPIDGWERYLEACSGDTRAMLLAEGSVLRRRVAAGLPPSVAMLVARMLSTDPSQRPSLKEVQTELQRYTTERSMPFGEPASVLSPIVDEESTVSDRSPTRATPDTSLTEQPSRGPASAAGADSRAASREARWAHRIKTLGGTAAASVLAVVLLLMGFPKDPPRILPDVPALPAPPAPCDVTITYKLAGLESLDHEMPLAVDVYSGPGATDHATFTVDWRSGECDFAPGSLRIPGIKCERDERGRPIAIAREARDAGERCDAWKNADGLVRDRNGTPTGLSFKADPQKPQKPSAARPGARRSIVLEGRFSR
jgi:serine/threonine-protein kinase